MKRNKTKNKKCGFSTFKKKKLCDKTLRKRLYAEAWKWFSLYIKTRDKWTCVTCGKDLTENRSQCHAGHYKHGVLDFSEVNLNAQCVGCNNYKHGNLTEYALYLTRKHGVNILEDLQARASMQKARPKKYTLNELQAIIDEYRDIPKIY